MANLLLGYQGYAISVYIISIMIAVSGFSLGIGYALNEKKFKEFGKEELYQSIINGILVGALILLFTPSGIIGGMINSLVVVNGTKITCLGYMNSNPSICLSYDYLAGSGDYTFMGKEHQPIFSMVSNTITSLLALNAVVGAISSVKINLEFVQFSFSYVFLPVITEIQYIIKILSTVAISVLVQAAVLSFVAVGALSIMLPLGLILRSFYPTRKLGGFFIAVSIGLYVVLPLSYLFNMAISSSFLQSASSSGIANVTYSAVSVENQLFSSNSYYNSTKENSIIGKISGAVTSLQNNIALLFDKIFSAVAYFIVYTFILPAFSLIITGISIRELSELLGSEASFGKFYILG